MRLIDADKLKCIYPADKEWHKVLNHAKTIKAIPISVIEDIKDEILCSYEKITTSQDEINLVKIARNNTRGECIDIIDKHIGGKE